MRDDQPYGLTRRRILKAGAAASFSSLFGNSRAFGHAGSNDVSAMDTNNGCQLCQAVKTPQLFRDGYKRPGNAALQSSILSQAASSGSTGRYIDAKAGLTGSVNETLIIEPSWVLVPDGDTLKLLHDYDVIIKGDRIDAVRPHRPGRDNRIVARGHILLPGFISGHTHSAAGTMTRGFIEENSFTAVQTDAPDLPGRSLLRPMVLMEDLNDEELDDLTALNLAEMLRSGCTTQVEMSLSLKQMKSYVRVAKAFGIRGYPSAMVPGIQRLLSIWGRTDDQTLVDSIPDTLAEIEANIAFAREINGVEHERIRPMMGPSVASVHTRETFAAIRGAAADLGNGTHIHIQNGWDANDEKALQRIWGKREIEIIQEVGLLDSKLFGAHLLGIDLEKDLPVLRHKNFTFAYCPSAAGAGVLPSSQPYPEAVAAGVNTSIGLDTHSNDYLENIKMGVMQGRARAHLLGRSSPVAMIEPTIWTGLKSATLGGARGLGRQDLGRIEAGAKADLCTVDVSGLLVGNGAMPREPYNNLLYANGLAVRNVMTDGIWQVLDGKLLFGDERQIISRAAVVTNKIWSQLDAEEFFVPMPR